MTETSTFIFDVKLYVFVFQVFWGPCLKTSDCLMNVSESMIRVFLPFKLITDCSEE